MKPAQMRRIGLILGLLTAVGPTAIDLYLPAFARIASDLQTTGAVVQTSLVSFFYALAVGQFAYGPISDAYGRKRPLYIGLSIFAVGSVACALAPTIHALIIARFIQGLGACVGIGIARAIVRDLHTGAEAARLVATIALVASVSPIFAPMLGSAILALFGWRAIFWLTAGSCVLLVMVVAGFLAETHPPARRRSAGFGTALGLYASLLRDRRFLAVALANAATMGLSFAFLAGSPYIYTHNYGLSSWNFAAVVALNGVFQISAAQITPSLIRAVGAWRLINTASLVAVGLALTLFIAASSADCPFLVLVGLIAALYACIGLLLAPLMIVLLDPLSGIAGTASALLGILQLVLGATIGAVVTAMFDGTVTPMVLAMAGCAVFAALSAQVAQVAQKQHARES